MKIRTYSELIKMDSFAERFQYLKLDGVVGRDTFGIDRYLNQKFYNSFEWKRLRNEIIARDFGCDLGVLGAEIPGMVLIHHMNPIRVDDIVDATKFLMDPEYLISVSSETHNAIHYGTTPHPYGEIIERKQGDTCPWKHI